jgi:hypothetical protein
MARNQAFRIANLCADKNYRLVVYCLTVADPALRANVSLAAHQLNRRCNKLLAQFRLLTPDPPWLRVFELQGAGAAHLNLLIFTTATDEEISAASDSACEARVIGAYRKVCSTREEMFANVKYYTKGLSRSFDSELEAIVFSTFRIQRYRINKGFLGEILDAVSTKENLVVDESPDISATLRGTTTPRKAAPVLVTAKNSVNKCTSCSRRLLSVVLPDKLTSLFYLHKWLVVLPFARGPPCRRVIVAFLEKGGYSPGQISMRRAGQFSMRADRVFHGRKFKIWAN